MSIENIQKFAAAASADPALAEKVQVIQQSAAQSVAGQLSALAAEAGYPFTADEFLANAATSGSELSDEALEAVAGGNHELAGKIAASIFTLGLYCATAWIKSNNDPNARDCM